MVRGRSSARWVPARIRPTMVSGAPRNRPAARGVMVVAERRRSCSRCGFFRYRREWDGKGDPAMPAELIDKLNAFDPTLPLEKAHTIPNAWYFDPEIYSLECHRVFGASWVVA